ncbi:hypothetical protein HK102_001079 [Quaeritorhiza haematococci]|nr:hypothetical protein HK102_001079 [Quaeritorhiza haematococci]
MYAPTALPAVNTMNMYDTHFSNMMLSQMVDASSILADVKIMDQAMPTSTVGPMRRCQPTRGRPRSENPKRKRRSSVDQQAAQTAQPTESCNNGLERKFICPHCSSAFARKNDLLRHIRARHTGEKPYQCEHCLKRFSRSDALKKHRESEEHQMVMAMAQAEQRQILASVPPMPVVSKALELVPTPPPTYTEQYQPFTFAPQPVSPYLEPTPAMVPSSPESITYSVEDFSPLPSPPRSPISDCGSVESYDSYSCSWTTPAVTIPTTVPSSLPYTMPMPMPYYM